MSVRARFPQTESMLYVDNAGCGLLSTSVQSALQEAVTTMAGGSAGLHGLMGRLAPLKAKLAQLIGATPAEIALQRSTSQGLNTVAAGVHWRPGDNVVTAGIEFPSNVFPWLNLEGRYGVKTKLVPAREGRVLAEDLIAACDERTRVLTVSWVQFTNGYRTDLAQLGEFCRARGILFCVDGVQGVGALQIDVERCQIDALACGAQKWMLGPLGIGFLYVRKAVQAELWTVEVGPGSVRRGDGGFSPAGGRPPDGSVQMDPASFLDYNLTFHESAARYESGLPNLLGVCGLDASVSLFLEVGPAAVEAQVLALTDQLAEGLVGRGYSLLSPRGAGERSGIITFVSERMASSEIHQRLTAAGVVCSLREGAVRLAPHFYNEAAEMEQILAALP
ncbi:MAG TPA: aminotransferase class V-fold PLP-dependent enzyme [Symbiobacteriaceae bacterium]|nr:aminotransferase class V-fold PLP-dependent enzyme [Symbiobacteriaceae bacterium]